MINLRSTYSARSNLGLVGLISWGLPFNRVRYNTFYENIDPCKGDGGKGRRRRPKLSKVVLTQDMPLVEIRQKLALTHLDVFVRLKNLSVFRGRSALFAPPLKNGDANNIAAAKLSEEDDPPVVAAAPLTTNQKPEEVVLNPLFSLDNGTSPGTTRSKSPSVTRSKSRSPSSPVTIKSTTSRSMSRSRSKSRSVSISKSRDSRSRSVLSKRFSSTSRSRSRSGSRIRSRSPLRSRSRSRSASR